MAALKSCPVVVCFQYRSSRITTKNAKRHGWSYGSTSASNRSYRKIGKDLRLSSVKRHVKGADAKVRLDIELPYGRLCAIPS